ncbi:hypothetical protein [Paenibacillus glucanolyticus]|uniref:hypothetical protein n=1 Tax=Paenibacillus glucanolyticus TaxID=59843 RepID=UPI00128E23B7|nr:hypothetical protein [Paenibacillus glucanolyticus]MPY15813.1 hypothetical protein [Paenibacillus glucanolyticus]
MSFFDKFASAFTEQLNDPEINRIQQEKAKVNEEIGLALETIREEALSTGYEFSFSPPAAGTDEAWATHFKGEMLVIFNTEVQNKNLQLNNTLESVKELLMEKIKYIR